MGIRSTASSTDVEKRMSLHRPVFIGLLIHPIHLFLTLESWNKIGTMYQSTAVPIVADWQEGASRSRHVSCVCLSNTAMPSARRLVETQESM